MNRTELAAFILGTSISMMFLVGVKNEAKPTVPVVIRPLEPVFKVYEETERFEIPKDYGTTEDERRKWSLLRDVIACETGSRWEVTPVPGKGYDVGPCQINSVVNALDAARKGYDLFVPNENMLYCIDLFERYYPAMTSGRWNPWFITQDCWEGRQEARRLQAKL